MSSRPCRDQGTASSRSTGPDASASAETEETVVPFARAASVAWVSGGARMVAESGSVRRTARRDDREPTLALRAGDAAAADGRLLRRETRHSRRRSGSCRGSREAAVAPRGLLRQAAECGGCRPTPASRVEERGAPNAPPLRWSLARGNGHVPAPASAGSPARAPVVLGCLLRWASGQGSGPASVPACCRSRGETKAESRRLPSDRVRAAPGIRQGPGTSVPRSKADRRSRPSRYRRRSSSEEQLNSERGAPRPSGRGSSP